MIFLCTACFHAIRVMENFDGQETTLLSPPPSYQGTECLFCRSKETLHKEEVAIDPGLMQKLQMRDLSDVEFFGAIDGLGLPEERFCDLDTLQGVMVGKKVKLVVGKSIPNTSRTLIDYLILEDGSRIYFGAGAQGAVVYRLVKPFKYSERM